MQATSHGQGHTFMAERELLRFEHPLHVSQEAADSATKTLLPVSVDRSYKQKLFGMHVMSLASSTKVDI